MSTHTSVNLLSNSSLHSETAKVWSWYTCRFQKLLQRRIAGDKLPSMLTIFWKWQVLFLKERGEPMQRVLFPKVFWWSTAANWQYYTHLKPTKHNELWFLCDLQTEKRIIPHVNTRWGHSDAKSYGSRLKLRRDPRINKLLVTCTQINQNIMQNNRRRKK